MTTVTRTVGFAVRGKRRSERVQGQAQARVPRISKLMALAIRYDQMLNDGVVESQSELAELLHVSQPRMTQIMNLLHLSPEIQECILFLEDSNGRSSCNERNIRSLASKLAWREQLRMWK